MKNSLSIYTKPTFTTDISEEIIEKANELLAGIDPEKIHPERAVIVVRRWINDISYDTLASPPRPYRNAGSLLDSRRAKASELIKDPVASCGSMVTLGTAILRTGGYIVRQVHGHHPKSDQHAWIEVYNSRTNNWEPYDFTSFGTGEAGQISEQHLKTVDCADWFDIKEIIIEEHKKYIQKKMSKNH